MRFLTRLIISLNNSLSRLSTKKNLSKDYLNALIKIKTRIKINKIRYIFLNLRASDIKNNYIYNSNIKE